MSELKAFSTKDRTRYFLSHRSHVPPSPFPALTQIHIRVKGRHKVKGRGRFEMMMTMRIVIATAAAFISLYLTFNSHDPPRLHLFITVASCGPIFLSRVASSRSRRNRSIYLLRIYLGGLNRLYIQGRT